MKKNLKVKVERAGLWFDTDLTYTQVPSWFGHTTKNLRLSVIRHFEGQPKPLPLVLWICGGGWFDVDHNAHLPNLVELAREGYVIASVEYRLTHEAQHPAQLEDLQAALTYLKANAVRFQIDTKRIGVMGESAGGYLATQLGVTTDVQGVCAWYPPVDLELQAASSGPGLITPEALFLGRKVKPGAKAYQATNPVAAITPKTPPFLLLHGLKDGLVSMAQSELLYDALEAHGVPVDLYRLEGADHASVEFFQPAVTDLIRAFFAKCLR
ncbi:MAG: alpha/beta hydrolase [Spirochaetales bacterium]